MHNRKIKRWGDSAVVTIPKEEMEAYNLEIGDFIDAPIIKVIKTKNVKGGHKN